ncbi:MAG: efflux RND transporter periplasmic adaptor subunit [Muribaculaceae bacterium]|nr:efflux RND transporter periplasmic adaptor subunit [Muribaculaceae bacterium]
MRTTLKSVAIIVASASLMAVTSCKRDDSNAQAQQQPPTIATITVQQGNSDLMSSYPATIKGKTDIDIRPQVSGFITKVHVDEGQKVRKGQPLFTIDQVQFQAAVDQAKAAVALAQTGVNTAALTAKTKQQLFDKNIISEYENQLAQNSLAQAQAQLAQANAALVTAQKNLAYTVVTAPSDGVVGKIPSREGSLASPTMTQPLTTVSDTGDVYAYFSLTEKDLLSMTDNGATTLEARIKSMPEVQLRLADGTIYPYPGKVATVSGTIDNTTGSSAVRALFKNSNGMLRSGSTGQILIPNHLENVISIPQKATSELQGKKFAYVVNDSNKVVAVPVEISPVNDGQNYIVISGLEAGQRIAVEGVGTVVRDGSVITPVDAAAKAGSQNAPQQ